MAKIEVVKQQDLKDCGACALSCVIRYYGGYVPLEKIRDDTLTNSMGTTAYHIIKAAENYGFEAIGIKSDNINNENIYFPLIAHVVLKSGLNHFVVVYKVTNTHVYVMDPAKGKVKLKKEEFKAIWDNVLILLNPISNIIHFDNHITISSLLFKMISKNKNLFIIVCLINTFLMIISILSSFYFQIAISSIQKGQDTNFLKFIILLFLFIFLFKVILNFIKNYYQNFFNKNLDTALFTDFLTHIFNLPLKFIQNRTTGEIISRVEELSEMKSLLADFFTNILLNSILVIGSVIALNLINNELFLVLCLVILIYVVVGLIFCKFIYSKIKENIEVATDFNAILIENIEMNTSIKNLNLVSNFLKRLENKLILMLKSSFKTENFLNNISLLKNFIYEIGLFIVMTYGIYLIYVERLELLSFITFNSLILYLFNPIKELIDLIPKYNYLKAAFNKLTDFINIKKEESTTGLMNIKSGKIEFNNVTYSYNKYNNIINNLSFIIESGEKVFIKGESGTGKSTICYLIFANQESIIGKIKIDGESNLDYSLEALRNNILYIGQNEKLFSGSFKDNIISFREISESEYLEIIKICKIEDIVNKRPNRYDTLINASLNNLSGGEKQRIILARGLLKKTRIIILDEALSEVDLELEKEIIENIKTYFKDSTLIYISHKNVENKFDKVIDMGEVNG